MTTVLERTRTGWDIILGGLLLAAGIVIIAYAAAATLVSVLFIGWVVVISGVVALAQGATLIGKGGFWPAAFTGGLLLVLGITLVRHPSAGAVALALVVGALFLMGGVVRLFAAFQDTRYRWSLLIGGVVSTVLGLVIIFELFTVSEKFLGLLLGIETIVDGLVLMTLGRFRVVE